MKKSMKRKARKKREWYKAITDYIPYGHENAIFQKDLVSLTGVKPPYIKEATQCSIYDGNLIISSVDGYFKPTTAEEVKDFYYRTHKYIRTHQKTLKCIKKALDSGIYEKKEGDTSCQ